MRSFFVLVTGLLMTLDVVSSIAETPASNPDLNGDGAVDEKDLVLLLKQWHVVDRHTATPIPTTTPTSTPDELPDEVVVDLPNLPIGAKPLVMIRIPAGSFDMGSNDDATWSWCYPCEQPVHRVEIGYDFYIGKYEVTQAHWEAVMGSNPAHGYGEGNDYPVYNVSWNDCQVFMAEIDKIAGGGFRLPSEAEWEYACRAGTTTRYSFGDSDCDPEGCDDCDLNDYAWWCDGSSLNRHVVGTKIPNSLGLYDMHGNVTEWCQDLWHGSYGGAPTDGSAWVTSDHTTRLLRGGTLMYAGYLRSASRIWEIPDRRINYIGFRLCRTPE